MSDSILMFTGMVISGIGMSFATFRYPPYRRSIKILGVIMSLAGYAISGYVVNSVFNY